MEQLRCLVCQGQSIADSDAELAGDMRAMVRARSPRGEARARSAHWLIERYGDWVSYKPPRSRRPGRLWLAPFAAAAAGVWLLAGAAGAARPDGLADPAAAGRAGLGALRLMRLRGPWSRCAAALMLGARVCAAGAARAWLARRPRAATKPAICCRSPMPAMRCSASSPPPQRWLQIIADRCGATARPLTRSGLVQSGLRAPSRRLCAVGRPRQRAGRPCRGS